MKNRTKIILTILISLVIIVLGVAIGSVFVSPADIMSIIGNKLFGSALRVDIAPTSVTIIWNLRLPRALLAFIVGAGLSVSGAMMQSILRNPLASSYTLGVSSGASLGAGLVLLMGASLPIMTMFSLPIMGFICGLATIFLVMGLSSRLGHNLENNTIILTGMVISLFTNAIVTVLLALKKEQMERLIYWQMGSFSLKDWSAVWVLAPVTLIGILFICLRSHELDMLTFGEDQALTMGVNIKRVKWSLLITSAVLTGSAVSFVGVIGFVDLIAPHIVRKIFGASHRLLIPMTALFGGAFMVLCDLAARSLIPARELPVGAVTALLGAPFFAYIYFGRSKKTR